MQRNFEVGGSVSIETSIRATTNIKYQEGDQVPNEQVEKKVIQSGIKLLEIVEEEIWKDRDR